MSKKIDDLISEMQDILHEKKAKLGSGTRFANLVKQLKAKGKKKHEDLREYKVKDPKALAAWIGAKKYGRKRMSKMAAAGKRRHSK